MAVYNQVLLYTFRDTLASGNPQKIIYGAYLDGEFGAIHSASLDAVSLSSNNTIAGNNSFTGTNTFSGTGVTTVFQGGMTVGAPSSGAALTVNGAAGARTQIVQANSTAGQSFGSLVSAGTNASDVSFEVTNAAGSIVYFEIFGDGHGTLGPSASSGLQWSTSGSVNIPIPSSTAVAFTVNEVSGGGQGILDIGPAGAWATIALQDGQTGARKWYLMSGYNNGASPGTFGIFDSTAAATRVAITTVGGVVVNTPTSGVALTLSGVAGVFSQQINGSTTGSGLQVAAGSTSANVALNVQNGAVTTNYFQVRGDGVIQGGGPVAGALVDMTPDQGSWTTTLTGSFSANPTGTMNWKRSGNFVTIYTTATILGTQTVGSIITASGLPAAVTPGATRQVMCVVEQNGGTFLGLAQVNSGGTISILISLTNSTPQPTQFSVFSATGNNGLPAGFSISYSL
jgi:hypothetical protein